MFKTLIRNILKAEVEYFYVKLDGYSNTDAILVTVKNIDV